jgi:hypothetical protein
MKLVNDFDKEVEFESLEEAKKYYYPEMEMTEEDYTGDNFAEYLKKWEEYRLMPSVTRNNMRKYLKSQM